MFLAKSGNALGVVQMTDGVIELNDIDFSNQAPTMAQMHDMTIDEAKFMCSRLGFRFNRINQNGRDAFFNHIIGDWDEMLDYALDDDNYMRLMRENPSKAKMVFFANSNGEVLWSSIASGQVMEYDNLENRVWQPLQMQDVMKMSMSHMRNVGCFLLEDTWENVRVLYGLSKNCKKQPLARALIQHWQDNHDLADTDQSEAEDGADQSEAEDGADQSEGDEDSAESTHGIADFLDGEDEVEDKKDLNKKKDTTPYTVKVVFCLEKSVLKMNYHYDGKATGRDLFNAINAKYPTNLNEDTAKIQVGTTVCHSEVYAYETIHAYASGTDGTTSIMIVPKLRGGGIGVRKSIGKSKKILEAVAKENFESAYHIANTVKEMSSTSFSSFLDQLKTDELQTLENDFKHGRGNIHAKLRNLISYNAEYQSIHKTIDVLTATADKMTETLVDAVSNECSDEKGNFKVAKLIEMMTVALKVKQKMASSSDAML